MNKEALQAEVLDASKRWISDFNQGNIKSCSERYLIDAVMEARPMGRFEGHKPIHNFWNEFIHETNATDLQYFDININVVNEHAAILSAKWTMNVGRGFIAKELWKKAGDNWFLAEDDFTVEAQY